MPARIIHGGNASATTHLATAGRAIQRRWRAADPAIILPVVLVPTAVLLRLGTIVRPSTIDWDESTFLLVGARLLHGELPYTTTFESKPPLASVLHALPLALRPGSLVAVRIALAMTVGLTAVIVAHVVARTSGRLEAGLLAGTTLILLAGAVPSGGAWMTQHSANLVLAVLLLVILPRADESDGRGPAFVARASLLGIATCTATLTRLNYAIPAAVGLLSAIVLAPARSRMRLAVSAAAGATSVLALVVAAYAGLGELDALRAGFIDLSLALRADAAPTTARLPQLARRVLGSQALLAAVAWVGTRTSTTAAARGLRRATLVATAVGSAAALSVVLQHEVWSHLTLIVVVPAAVQAGLTLSVVLDRAREAATVPRRLATVAVLATLVVTLVETDARTLASRVGIRPPDEGAWAREAAVTAAVRAALDERPGRVLALDDHYALWRLDIPPAHPMIAHPSNLAQPEWWANSTGFNGTPRPTSTIEAFTTLLDTGPRYVLARRGLEHGFLELEEAERMRAALDAAYVITWSSSDGRVDLWACRTC